MAAKKTGKSNFGPEFAKRVYETTLREQVPYNPEWDGRPQRQKETFDNTKVRVKPGKTRIGTLGTGRGAVGGFGGGLMDVNK